MGFGFGFGGLVFKAHRLAYHSTLGWRVIKKKKKKKKKFGFGFGVQGLGFSFTSSVSRVKSLGYGVSGLFWGSALGVWGRRFRV